jgi:hypothetical protein
MNPYNPCAWNKIIEKKQITICFHVNDCKVSHKLAQVVDKAIKWLRQDYESAFEDGSGAMVVHRGDVHKYLGMTIDYSTKGVTLILMVDYVEDMVVAWDKAFEGIELDSFKIKYRKLSGQPTAAPSNLFMVNKDLAKLPEEQKAAFHNVAAKALYVAKQARPNKAVSIAFLTTQVHSPDVQD